MQTSWTWARRCGRLDHAEASRSALTRASPGQVLSRLAHRVVSNAHRSAGASELTDSGQNAAGPVPAGSQAKPAGRAASVVRGAATGRGRGPRYFLSGPRAPPAA